jgi:G3E family GTPase
MTLDGRPGRPWNATEQRLNEIVFIGRNLDADLLRDGFVACFAATSPSTTPCAAE